MDQNGQCPALDPEPTEGYEPQQAPLREWPCGDPRHDVSAKPHAIAGSGSP